jgi:epoxyqueuosine reductase
MKEAIRARALELGFDDCRFTSARAPASAAHFDRWIQSGQHGTMGYLARNAQKRMNPQMVLSGAATMVCVALNYGPARSPGAECSKQNTGAPGTGVVARYARHMDYHELMGDRLTQLSAFMDSQGTAHTRSLWYVDTGPILERDFAQRAGLGFVGKHTNLISRQLGNWILLGEILTTLELEPDDAEKNRCGTCTRCLSACPTEAITAPFQLDARRCISYLTIEHKGAIPQELRPALGNRIFGCDDCLEVCPWNRFAAEARALAPYRRDDLQSPDLLALLSLDAAAFRQRFRGTPIERSKRRGLLRNVCVALGNTAGKEALPALETASADPEPLIAEHAQWAMTRIA